MTALVKLCSKQRRLLESYAYTRPLWLGLLGGAVASLLRSLDHGASPVVEDVALLRERGDKLVGFPELEAAVCVLLQQVSTVPLEALAMDQSTGGLA